MSLLSVALLYRSFSKKRDRSFKSFFYVLISSLFTNDDILSQIKIHKFKFKDREHLHC